MFSGMVPFRGQSSIETIHAILHSQPPPLRAPSLSAAAADDVQRIIDKCLAKDPDDRYQGMKDLVVDLKAARRRTRHRRRRRRRCRPAAAPVAAKRRANLRCWSSLRSRLLPRSAATGSGATQSRRPIAEATGTRPSVAVMHFENNTGDKEMDWLRTGLTDMLVTDLSQSHRCRSIEHRSAGADPARPRQARGTQRFRFETVQEVARRAGVKHVLLGSYVKAGDAIRINVKLQDASTGRIISTERVDAPNEASLFPTMDDLTRRVKTRFVASRRQRADADCCRRPAPRPVAGARSRLERRDHIVDGGLPLLRRRRRAEPALALSSTRCRISSVPSQVDPNFALAYVKMAVGRRQHRPLQRARRVCRRKRCARRSADAARALLHRGLLLTANNFYTTRAGDRRISEGGRALSRSFGVAQQPRVFCCTDSIRTSEQSSITTCCASAASSSRAAPVITPVPMLALNRGAEAVQLLEDFTGRFPNVEAGYLFLGMAYQATNRLDQAKAAFERALAIRPEYPPAVATLRSSTTCCETTLRARRSGHDRWRRPRR